MGTAGDKRLWKRLLDVAENWREQQDKNEGQQLFKLTLNQLRMIKNVHGLTEESGGGIKLKELAESLDITPAAASEMVETLVGKGVLTRVNSSLDRRSVSIQLGDSLKKNLRSREAVFDRAVSGFLDVMPEAERKLFLEQLAGLIVVLENTVERENPQEVAK